VTLTRIRSGFRRNHSRRVRRWAAAAIFLSGVADLLGAIDQSIRTHLHVVLQVLPLCVTHAVGGLGALAGVGLLALARGMRRGQRRAWGATSILLGVTLVLHLVRGGDVGGPVVAGATLAFLLINRREFRSPSELSSVRSAAPLLLVGAVAVTVISILAVELRLGAGRSHMGLWSVAKGVVERLVGVQIVALQDRLNDVLGPSLVVIGFAITVVTLGLLTRPLVDRARSQRTDWDAARDIVRRHGGGTLDYFALRNDKRWFFHGDSLVAYGVFGGICLVSPDPIGPVADRAQVWKAFWRFADSRSWVVAVMAGSEEWLPVYRDEGMHTIYIGDEAVVDVQHFSLGGGHMKGLRQARNRIANHGYTASFHDPGHLDPHTAERLKGLMPLDRRGDFERGFSMMLGRIFDPLDEGLLLCVVTDPDGVPAAVCQFVPARHIGGYSLDILRRDHGDHPNGLIDFALVSTIEHLRELGCRGLSLYFAGLRSVIDGERGDAAIQRVERWAVKEMSRFLPIETLVRFNAKYEPEWLPRYLVYDSAEYLLPVLLAILRAESLEEVPIIGRFVGASQRQRRRKLPAEPEDPSDDCAEENRDTVTSVSMSGNWVAAALADERTKDPQ
jgi:lysylphosphatidylglycerol synthetase-like protein (DUF2156 family)